MKAADSIATIDLSIESFFRFYSSKILEFGII